VVLPIGIYAFSLLVSWGRGPRVCEPHLLFYLLSWGCGSRVRDPRLLFCLLCCMLYNIYTYNNLGKCFLFDFVFCYIITFNCNIFESVGIECSKVFVLSRVFPNCMLLCLLSCSLYMGLPNCKHVSRLLHSFVQCQHGGGLGLLDRNL
jgi:hypothetical protein